MYVHVSKKQYFYVCNFYMLYIKKFQAAPIQAKESSGCHKNILTERRTRSKEYLNSCSTILTCESFHSLFIPSSKLHTYIFPGLEIVRANDCKYQISEDAPNLTHPFFFSFFPCIVWHPNHK